MAAEVKKAVAGWKYDVVSIGYPGAVKNGRPARDPHNLAKGWMRFDYRKAFGKPVKLVNDAAMQALGAYEGGRMLFLGLGTGLGSALIAEGVVMPMELAHLPYRGGQTYEDFLGERGLIRLGRKKWTRQVHKVVALLRFGLQADHVVLGGGQTKKLKELPPNVRVGTNQHAVIGGLRMWEGEELARRPSKPSKPKAKPRKASAPKARKRRKASVARPAPIIDEPAVDISSEPPPIEPGPEPPAE
jgi:predicted NBD/HSP70 family sugar kinase